MLPANNAFNIITSRIPVSRLILKPPGVTEMKSSIVFQVAGVAAGAGAGVREFSCLAISMPTLTAGKRACEITRKASFFVWGSVFGDSTVRRHKNSSLLTMRSAVILPQQANIVVRRAEYLFEKLTALCDGRPADCNGLDQVHL